MFRTRVFILRNLFLIIGIFFTMLIHCTWPYGDNDNVFLLLANCVGRCGLFLFVIWIGDFIWLSRDRLKTITVIFLQIYVFGFMVHSLSAFITGEYFFSLKKIVHIVGGFLRGTPGNIWIVYRAFLLCVLICISSTTLVAQDYENADKNNAAKNENDKKSVDDGIWQRGGAIYSIIALFLFLYANIYMYIYTFDNGIVINGFIYVLGSNRPAIILGVPFMFFGYRAHVFKFRSRNLAVIGLVSFLAWCIEVVFINEYLHISNIHMTFVGAICCMALYLLISDRLRAKVSNLGLKDMYFGDLSDVYFMLVLFVLQYSIHGIVSYYMNIQTKDQLVSWLAMYMLITWFIIALYYVMWLRITGNHGKNGGRNSKQYSSVNTRCSNWIFGLGSTSKNIERKCGIATLNHFKQPATYAVWTKDEDVRYKSTSGGAFTELAKNIINKGGVVAGARYNDECLVEHCLVDSVEGLEEIRQSKYMSSVPGNIYINVKDALEAGKLVGFCGAPCQVLGLYSFLGRDYDNLITMDFICRGMNSPKAFRAWLSELEKEEGSKAKKVWFKYKEGGWKSSPKRTRIDFEDGHYVVKEGESNLYMHGYLTSNLYIRPSCGSCTIKGVPRQGDITLADFWGIDSELDDDKGTSMLLVNSEKGGALFSEIRNNLVVHQRNFTEIFNGNPMFSTSTYVPKEAHDFLVDLDNMSFTDALKKFDGYPLGESRIKKFLRKIKKHLSNHSIS